MQHEWAENRLAEFKLWAAGTGVFAGDKTSLDARLAVNLETKNLITSILILLIDCIEKCKKLGELAPVVVKEQKLMFDCSNMVPRCCL